MLNRSAADGASRAFELVTFGENGRLSKRNLDKSAAWIEAEDFGRYGEQTSDP